MTWNYRLVQLDEDWIEIKEVFYDKNGNPEAYTDTEVGGEDPDAVLLQLTLMQEALAKPILTLDAAGRFVFGKT